jgi:putative methyltransferase (TIGR04325 family)
MKLIKKILKLLMPSILMILYKKLIAKKSFIYGFSDWNSAVVKSTTYNTEDVFKKTLSSARKVRDGLAVYERDSVIFNKIQYDWALLSSLMFITNVHNRLNVLDYGGALGTTYRQNKKFFDLLDCKKSWIILEQKRFVDIGKHEFSNNELSFINSLDELNDSIDLVLLGSSICYFEKPYGVLANLIKLKPNFILITKTPFSDLDEDNLSIQIIRPSIYNATYPVWTFSKNKFMNYMVSSYNLVEEWEDQLQHTDDDRVLMGMLFKLKT